MKQYNIKINGNSYDITVESVSGNNAKLNVNGTGYDVEFTETGKETQPVQRPTVRETPVVEKPVAKTTQEVTGGKSVKSPLPGVIVSILVTPGDIVKAGQVVAVIEAMKMENEILSEYDGTVTAVNVKTGVSVLEGDTIASIG